jgi:hypothetical protein
MKFIDVGRAFIAVHQIAKYVTLWNRQDKFSLTTFYDDKGRCLGETRVDITRADFENPICVPASPGQTIFWGYAIWHDDPEKPDDIEFVELPVLAWRLINHVGDTYVAEAITIECIEEDFRKCWILYPVPGGYMRPDEGIRETLDIWKEELLKRARGE